MTKIFFTSDIHLSHRAICAFSPSRIKIFGLDSKYSEQEVVANHALLKNDKTDPVIRKSVKAFFEQLILDMDRAIIELWNDTVGFSDEVYVLGDISFAREEATAKFLERMHGRIYLVRGNHDKGTDRLDRFEWVKDYHRATIDGHSVVMFHYPIFEWDGMHHGSFHLYGHVHGKDVPYGGRCMDVAPEATKKVAVEWADVKRELIKREVRTHHDAEREQSY